MIKVDIQRCHFKKRWLLPMKKINVYDFHFFTMDLENADNIVRRWNDAGVRKSILEYIWQYKITNITPVINEHIDMELFITEKNL